MIESVEDYLEKLEAELAGSDRAILQDALTDAEDHLRTALEHHPDSEIGVSEADALIPIIEKYGTPEEIAAAYQEIAMMTEPPLALFQPAAERSWFSKFFGVIADARAWGALLYLLFSIVIGFLYFTWAVAGLSLSLGLMVLIIGLPFTALFLLSVQSIAFVEGRIVEALLGVRMPRRPLFTNRQGGRWEQIKSLFREGRTWTALVYMILKLPLGVIYFTVFITLILLSLVFIGSPILVLVLDIPLLVINELSYYPSPAVLPLIVLAGVVLFLTVMHLAKFVGRQHGALAKALLVGGRTSL